MNISKLIGQRINDLMTKESVSLRKLSESIGITHPTLAKYIDGSQPIDSEKLMKIALFFNQPFDYFFKNDNHPIKFLFRANNPKANMLDHDVDSLLTSIYSYNDVLGETGYDFIPQKYILTEPKDKSDVFSIVAKVAHEQRRMADIDNVIPDNYYEVIQNFGIHVIVKNFKNDAFFGASSYSPEQGCYILINDADHISEERKIFSLLHEYGHLLFHADQYVNPDHQAYYQNGKYELEEKIANQFAGYFLMPRSLVQNYVDSRKEIDVYEMKRYFKVSLQTLYFMLHEYGYITKAKYLLFWKQLNRNKLKTEEPAPLEKMKLEDKNIRIIPKIKELYSKQEISANKIEEVLGLDVFATRKLLKEWRTVDERYLSLK